MGKSRKGTKAKTESVAETFLRFFRNVLNIIISVYVLAILVVQPFYNEEGYTHIGTDKAMFFRNTAIKCGMALWPVLGAMLLFKLFIMWTEYRGAKNNAKEYWQHKWVTVKTYCREQISITDYFAFAYGFAVIVSYICTSYKEEAWWGTTGWYMGMLPHLIVVISYFLISRAWKSQKLILFLAFPASAIVFVLGYLNRFGIFPIDMVIENQPSFVSTVGNINWFCGYIVSVFFAGFCLLWNGKQMKAWQQFLLIAYALTGFAALITNGSASGMVAMAGVVLVTFCLSAKDAKRMENFWMEMYLLAVVCVITYLLRRKEVLTITYDSEVTTLLTNHEIVIVLLAVSVLCYAFVKLTSDKGWYPQKLFSVLAKGICILLAIIVVAYFVVVYLNTKSGGALLQGTLLAGNPMFTFSAAWGSSRGATFMAGIGCFMEQDFLHKLFGVGPDCMAIYLQQDGSTELLAAVQERFGQARLTNAHNEWLTLLVNEGIVGVACFVGMMVTAIKRQIGSYKSNVVAAACGFCVLAYTINNMFSFQTSMCVPTIFIVMAVGENYLRNQKSDEKRSA